MQKDIQRLQEQINAMVFDLDSMHAQLEMISGKLLKPEWPQIGDTIFRLNSQGNIVEDVWRDINKQNSCRDFLGVYKTRREIERVAEKILMHRNNCEFDIPEGADDFERQG